jgi:hypothetical protein
MRNACKTFAQLSLTLALFITCSALARAQARDPRLVSARAGGVNFVSGDVTMRRAGRESWQGLRQTDNLQSGDTVRTGADGHAEVLLNPGSYLRLGANSELELTDSSLDALRLKLTKGSALVEASIYGEGAPPIVTRVSPMEVSVVSAGARSSATGFRIEIDTPQTQVLLVRSGIYRINVGSTTELYVRDGRALVGRDWRVVKEGKAATVATGGAVEVAKFDKKQKDELDLWSKRRAQEVARVNNQLQVRTLNTAFMRMAWDNFGWGYNPTGLWYWDTRALSYTYIPFYRCRSPYGYDYGVAAPGLYNACGCHLGFNNSGGMPNIVRNGGGTSGGGGWTSGGTTTSGGGGGTTNGGGGSTFGGGGGTVTRTPADSGPVSTMSSRESGTAAHRVDPPLRDQ